MTMLVRAIVAMAGAAVLLAGCGGSDGAAPGDARARTLDVPVGDQPGAGQPLPFTSLASAAFSGVHDARRVVVRDAAAWAALWAEHTAGRSPAPALPPVDFGRRMLVGVFSGDRATGCHTSAILRLGARDGRLVVEYEERDVSAVALCLPGIAQPMEVVAVDRTDAAVGFVKVTSRDLPFETISATGRSGVVRERQVVVDDAEAWARLWREHAGPETAVPAVDFARKRVVGVFRGAQPSGCHGTSVARVRLLGAGSQARLLVRQVEADPGPAVMCTMALVHPAHLVAVERDDTAAGAPVEFSKEIRLIE